MKNVKAKCRICGKEFATRKSEQKRGMGKYCSLSCAAKSKHIDHDDHGENNPNWKGGISKDPYHYRLIQKERFPEKSRCRAILAKAIKIGKIKRLSCEICGDPNTDGHHNDYSKPLEVHWLCEKHHRELHQGMGWNKGKKIVGNIYELQPN